MSRSRFGMEVRADPSFSRASRRSFVMSCFVCYDSLHPSWLISANKNWKRYRKKQYKINRQNCE